MTVGGGGVLLVGLIMLCLIGGCCQSVFLFSHQHEQIGCGRVSVLFPLALLSE